MQLQSLDRFVDSLALAMQGEADEIERVGRDRLDRGAVGFVMAGGEEFAGVERGAQARFAGSAQHAGKVGGGRGEDQHRLTDQRPIDLARAVAVSFAAKFGRGGDEPTREEAGDVELLPAGKLLVDDDGNLGVEAHDGHDRERAAGRS